MPILTCFAVCCGAVSVIVVLLVVLLVCSLCSIMHSVRGANCCVVVCVGSEDSTMSLHRFTPEYSYINHFITVKHIYYTKIVQLKKSLCI